MLDIFHPSKRQGYMVGTVKLSHIARGSTESSELPPGVVFPWKAGPKWFGPSSVQSRSAGSGERKVTRQLAICG